MQTAFKLSDDYGKRAAERRLLDAICQAVANISIKELAYALDVSPSLLSDALNERSNKGVRASWLLKIVEMAPLADAMAILNAIGDAKRLEAQQRQELTAEEKAERLEEKLRSLGATGLRLIEEAIGAGR